jgi:hypothetical protein
MSLDTRCPKCEAHVREGARQCPMCGMPLSVMAFEPPAPVEGEPVVDPLLGLFERDEPTRVCPSCGNEFLSNLKACGGCGETLRVMPRSHFEAQLRFRPVFDRGSRLAKGPGEHPRDLIRIHACKDPDEARARLKEFRFMGVRVWTGSDALDASPEIAKIGLYVRPADHESAKYLLEGAPKPPPDRPGSRPAPRTPRERLLDLARGYFELGKFKQTIALLRELPGDPEADDLASEALLFSGAVREAERAAVAAADAAAGGAGRGRLLMNAGVFAALGNDGTPFGPGSRIAAARERLAGAAAAAPRLLDAGKALVEVLHAAKEDHAALAELRRLSKLNPNVLALDGWFRSLHEELRSKLG